MFITFEVFHLDISGRFNDIQEKNKNLRLVTFEISQFAISDIFVNDSHSKNIQDIFATFDVSNILKLSIDNKFLHSSNI